MQYQGDPLVNQSTRTGALVAIVLFTAACGDAASRLTGPNGLDGFPASSSSFAVLANAAVTCTDGNITGDIGTFAAAPTGSVTLTTCPVAGDLHVGDSSAQQAFNEFVDTYAALARQAGDDCTYLTGTQAGVILAPGSYCFGGAATLTGLLTLDGPADGIWSFKVGSNGTGALTATTFSMVMAGGGQPCNVTWWVADATTLTGSAFLGNLMAGAAITRTGGTAHGNTASKADVTVTGTVVQGCSGSVVSS
jgi:hypothetical protein